MNIVDALKKIKNDLLNFITENLCNKADVYVQNAEPTGALEGSLWIDLDAEIYDTHNTVEIPAVTESDNGKFMRVVDGAWAATSITIAEEMTV